MLALNIGLLAFPGVHFCVGLQVLYSSQAKAFIFPMPYAL